GRRGGGSMGTRWTAGRAVQGGKRRGRGRLGHRHRWRLGEPDARATTLDLERIHAALVERTNQPLHELQVDHAFTLERYLSSVRSILSTSPSSTKSGTWTTAPVSRVAGFVAPCAVSPLKP